MISSAASILRTVFAATALLALPACVYQPLYGTNSYMSQDAAIALAQIHVAEVDSRVGQQVRNQLIFQLQGGRDIPEPVYELRLRVTDNTRLQAAIKDVADNTAGVVSVIASYDLINVANHTRVAGGSRSASASFDRTGQSFSNERAVRDAQNRAARLVAEELRLALAADIAGIQ
ncbi:MAG: LPS assembly lipoprotein LptE [Salaquimonas sp.]|nr:LPS assembly lipoprotein LptE [Salaquimonas sp.]